MDRGSAMKSDTLAQLLASLGASRSFSRPRVSDDNPFSESQFKTMKYQPDYPGRFDGELHGRGWLQDFFGWHNDDHHHSSLALFTPADVFFGRVAVVAEARQLALDLAYSAHPERFTRGAPRVALPPAAVHINPLTADALLVLPAPSARDETSTPAFVMNTRSQRLAALPRSALGASIAT
jgi:putative transposase